MLSASSVSSSSPLSSSSSSPAPPPRLQRLMLPAPLRPPSPRRARVPARRSPICSRNAEHKRSPGMQVVVAQHPALSGARSRVCVTCLTYARVSLPCAGTGHNSGSGSLRVLERSSLRTRGAFLFISAPFSLSRSFRSRESGSNPRTSGDGVPPFSLSFSRSLVSFLGRFAPRFGN